VILNLNQPRLSAVAYKSFAFPDGQPHFQIEPSEVVRAAESGPIDLLVALKNPSDLINVGLAIDAIASVSNVPINLNISYLLGARMDRRIAPGHSATLAVLCNIIQLWSKSLQTIRILDPHSVVALQHLPQAVVLTSESLLAFALKQLSIQEISEPVIVVPDQGAISRTTHLVERLGAPLDIAYCSKQRESATGKLSGFQFDSGNIAGRNALIVDDICDGGGTFSGIAQVLKKQGANQVFLCVTHGVFSKGIVIDGIDQIFTTDSFGLPNLKDDVLIDHVAQHQYSQYRVASHLGHQLRLTVLNRFVENLIAS
jgi:ribose-phosphate pyrophosphokinase